MHASAMNENTAPDNAFCTYVRTEGHARTTRIGKKKSEKTIRKWDSNSRNSVWLSCVALSLLLLLTSHIIWIVLLASQALPCLLPSVLGTDSKSKQAAHRRVRAGKRASRPQDCTELVWPLDIAGTRVGQSGLALDASSTGRTLGTGTALTHVRKCCAQDT